MREVLTLITEEVTKAFVSCGYEEKYGKVSLSNRPDLCEFQCNGAMAAAKAYKKAPILIAQEVAEALKGNGMFSMVEPCKPGFLNLKLSEAFLAKYVGGMAEDERFGLEKVAEPKTIMIDYGGPNVAKPLHVGHLRSAIIGESIKRIGRYMGHNCIGDVHLGDWGLQMGLIITELKLRQPDLVYFDPDYTGEYPKEAPFTISELEEIYPTASGKSKKDPAYKEAAMAATYELQHGNRGYQALLGHILNVSVTDLKKNYENLNVSFELWKGESDAQPYIPDMVQKMKDDGYAYISEGALVVDKRQELYFTQVFRCARKTGIVDPDTELKFVGFGTMNGKDGRPFKTREGGVMRLETLVNEVDEKMYEKIIENHTMSEEEARNTAKIVALSAIKYGDLSNQASKDYVFDVDRFTSFEGNTGPYILYTIVRIKSILKKYAASGKSAEGAEILPAETASQKDLMLSLSQFNAAIRGAYEETAPHKVCAYIYELANAFNRFYHENNIMGEADEKKQAGFVRLLELTRDILEQCIDLLGFEAPERM